MTSYTDAVGGAPIQPSDVAYKPITISVDTQFSWPFANEDSGDVVASVMDVTSTVDNTLFKMPDATQVSRGQYQFFINVGSGSFIVSDTSGNPIQNIPPGQVFMVYLTDNSTQDGAWTSIAMGIGTSAATASGLAGYGIQAIASRLSQKHNVFIKSIDYNIGLTDRAATIVSDGGVVIFSFDAPATLTDGWFVLVKNSGTGNLTLTPSVGTIDGETSITLGLLDACFVITDGVGFYTVGLGKIVSRVVTRLVIPVTGGNVSVTAIQATYDIIEFAGVLVSDLTVKMPVNVNEWNLFNNTTGAFACNVIPVSGTGTGIGILQGVRSFYICDGTNIVSAIPDASIAVIPPALGGTWDYYGGTSVGSADAQIIATAIPTPYPQDEGTKVWFIAGYTNATTTPTLQVEATPAAVIVKHDGGGIIPVAAGDIPAGVMVGVIWDGTNYQLINQVGGGGSGSSFRGAMVNLTANYNTAASATAYNVPWDNMIYDTNSFFDIANPTKLTVPAGVTYVRISCGIIWAASATGYRTVTIRKNATGFAGQPQTINTVDATVSQATSVTTSAPIAVSATDYFECRVTQTSGGALDVVGNITNPTWFAIEVVA